MSDESNESLRRGDEGERRFLAELRLAEKIETTLEGQRASLSERPHPVVPDHELLRRIGGGSYGEVWLAKNVVGTFRAVKIVYRDSFSDSRPYEREYRGIQKFEPVSRSNDGFMDILQIGRNDELGCFYYIMELADNGCVNSEDPEDYIPKTLQEITRQRGRLKFEECLQYAMPLNLALGHLHRQGLIHRDIKPSNIIFIGGIPKLADIGLVTDVGEARSFVGTEGFIPPEGPNSPQADIYSLGKVLYEMSMGKDRTEFPEPFTELGQGAGSQELEELNAVILKACASDPANRYQTAEEMHVDLALLQNGKSVKAKRMLERRLGFARRAGAVVATIAMIAIGAYVYQQSQTQEARSLAQKESFQRSRAENLLNQLQLKQAEHFFETDEAGKGVAYLARLLRKDPANQIAATRLISALTQRSFALPLRVFEHTENLHQANFSPDGQRIVTSAGDDFPFWNDAPSQQNSAAGTARIWDARTGELVGKPMRHERTVRSARFSPDGRLILTASRDGTARLWDAATGDPVCPPLRHEKPHGEIQHEVRAEFSENGQAIVTTSGPMAQVWKATTGEPLTPPLDHGASPIKAFFSADRRFIVTSSRTDSIVKIWDIEAGKTARVFDHAAEVYSARFSPDGSQLLTAGGFQARLWGIETGALIRLLQHEGTVVSARFSSDGLRIATGDFHRAVRVWDAQTGNSLVPPLMHKMEANDAQFDATGEMLLTQEQRGARVWNSRTGQPLGERMLLVRSAQFSPDGRQILTMMADRTATLWELRPGQTSQETLIHQGMVSSAKFNAAGDRIVTASGGIVFYLSRKSDASEAAVWDARSGKPVAPPIKIPGGVQYAEFSPEGRTIVTAARNQQARIWNAQTGEPITVPLQHNGEVWMARFSANGNKVVTASEDKTARVWDARTGRPLTDPLVHTNELWAAEFSPDGRWIVTTPKAKVGRIWNAETGQMRPVELSHAHSNDGRLNEAHFSPDGQRLVTASDDGTARIWDSQTGQPLTGPLKHPGPVLAAQFSPNGRYVIATSEDQLARIWETETGKPVTEPLQHKGPVIAAQWSPDSRRVVTASIDNTARVWDAQSGRPLTEPLRHKDWVAYAEFSPDGARVLTASSDGTAQVWELPMATVPVPAWVIEFAEAVVGLRLDDQEAPEAITPAEFLNLKKRILDLPNTDHYTAWAKWLLADRQTRSPAPPTNTSFSSE